MVFKAKRLLPFSLNPTPYFFISKASVFHADIPIKGGNKL